MGVLIKSGATTINVNISQCVHCLASDTIQPLSMRAIGKPLSCNHVILLGQLMKLMSLLFAISVVSTNVWAKAPEYIDLTHTFAKETLHWPNTPPFNITHEYTGSESGYFVSVWDYASSEHVGTHADAPNHFAKGHRGISEIPLEALIGSAIKVDVSQEVKKDRDHQISVNDLQQWEAQHGKIQPNTIVLFSTGYGKYWDNQTLYSGTQKTGPDVVKDLHFPGLSPQAALWLIQERKIKAVGIDTFSIRSWSN